MDGFHSTFMPGAAAVTNPELRDAFFSVIGETPEELVYVFTTGPVRASFYRNGGVKNTTHGTVDRTLEDVSARGGHTIHLKYLSNADEAKYGFETLLEHSKDVLDDVLAQAEIPEDLTGIVTSGTTSFQAGVYNRATGTIDRMDSFDYGTNNRNPEGLDAFRTWMEAQTDVQNFVSIGSESYAAPKGKIATNLASVNTGRSTNGVLSGLDTSARAYEAVLEVFNMATSIGKTYYTPERKTWDLKTSATLALRKLYPTGRLLDWGGGQIKDDEAGKKTAFDQRMLM